MSHKIKTKKGVEIEFGTEDEAYWARQLEAAKKNVKEVKNELKFLEAVTIMCEDKMKEAAK